MQSATILVVEDNELNSMFMTDLLEVYDYSTRLARDGQEAMLIARAQRPDLIIMDIQLPGMSGLEVIGCLKKDEELQSIPIIAVTAFAMLSEERIIRAAGCDDYVSKPIDIEVFLKIVGQQLANPRAQRLN